MYKIGGGDMGNDITRYIRLYATLLGGVITALLGGWDVMMQVLVLFVVLDYITGIVAAFVEKRLNSVIGFKGICKKILLFVPVMVSCALDVALGTEILRSLSIWFYVANEGLSIIENLGKANVPIPKPLMTALEQLKAKGDDEGRV